MSASPRFRTSALARPFVALLAGALFLGAAPVAAADPKVKDKEKDKYAAAALTYDPTYDGLLRKNR